MSQEASTRSDDAQGIDGELHRATDTLATIISAVESGDRALNAETLAEIEVATQAIEGLLLQLKR